MSKSEIDVLQEIDLLLSGFEDPAARNRVLTWAWEKYSTKPLLSEEPQAIRNRERPTKARKKKINSTKPKKGLALIRDLNLKPSGKKSLLDFVTEKQPSSNLEKCTISVYYLRNILKIATVSIDHIYTCFKAAKWRIPADLANALQVTSSRHGWLDTRDKNNINLTTHGENLIEHDLPKAKLKS